VACGFAANECHSNTESSIRELSGWSPDLPRPVGRSCLAARSFTAVVPGLSSAVRRCPSVQVDGLYLSAGVAPERQKSERLAVTPGSQPALTGERRPIGHQAIALV
jgi:hypothetical protein